MKRPKFLCFASKHAVMFFVLDTFVCEYPVGFGMTLQTKLGHTQQPPNKYNDIFDEYLAFVVVLFIDRHLDFWGEIKFKGRSLCPFMRVFILNSVWNRATMKRPQCRNCTWEKSTNPSFVQSHLPHVRIQFEPSRIFTRTKFFGCFTRSWYSTLFLIGRCKLSRALDLFHLCLCSLLPVSESWRKL